MSLKVLHLYANHKWTGPAELAIQQVRRLHAAGSCRAELALAGHHDPALPHAVERRCGELDVPVRRGLALRRHFHLRDFWRDAGLLARWIDASEVDLLHCHQAGDHFVAALALRRSRRRVPLVRSFWENEMPGPGPRTWLSFRAADRVLAPFPAMAERLRRRFGLDDSRLGTVPPILGDTPSLDGEQVARRRQALRDELGLDPVSLLIGLTARIQPRRRWDLAWDTVDRLARRFSRLHLCVLGRPDEGVFETLCRRPLAERGLTHRVHFLGYRQGEAYFRALAAMDAFLFLVPGSDATCRALREAMAMGLPSVTTNLGQLSGIVRDGETGRVLPPHPDALAGALGGLCDDATLRERLGREAAQFARREWQGPWQEERLLATYKPLVTASSPAPRFRRTP